MTKEEFEVIMNQTSDIKNLPNAKLVEIMDKLTGEFEIIKNEIIKLTYHLDNVEIIYNKVLNEYKNRVS